MKEEKLACIAYNFPFLSCIPSSKSPSLHAMPHLPQPSIAWCQSILYNKQTNKTSYPSSQAFFK
jgi:hypothetical protein